MMPFRLGATCFIYEADLVTNARQLAPFADDIELVLYETEQWGTNFPSPAQVAELDTVARDNHLTYTVHLPLDLKLGDARAFDQARRAIEVTRALGPFGYVMHLDGSPLVSDASAAALSRWQAEAVQILAHVTGWVGDAARVCVENVEVWNPDFFAEVVAQAQVSRCIDIGHLWKEGCDPVPHLVQHLPHTRIVHLHGLGTRDHQSLTHMRDPELFPVVETLLQSDFRGVVTLEVFGPDDFFTSRECLVRAIEQISIS